jgi:hypothetical protein
MQHKPEYEKTKAWLQAFVNFCLAWKIIHPPAHRPMSPEAIHAFETKTGLDLGVFMRAYFEVLGSGVGVRIDGFEDIIFSLYMLEESLPEYERIRKVLPKVALRTEDPYVPKDLDKILILNNGEETSAIVYIYLEQKIPDFLIFWDNMDGKYRIERVATFFQHIRRQLFFNVVLTGQCSSYRAEKFPEHSALFKQIPWMKPYENCRQVEGFRNFIILSRREFDKIMFVSGADPYMDLESYELAFFEFLEKEKGYPELRWGH